MTQALNSAQRFGATARAQWTRLRNGSARPAVEAGGLEMTSMEQWRRLRAAEVPAGRLHPRIDRFWKANLAVWAFISTLGFFTRTLFFGNMVDAVIVTLVLDSIGFGLTSLAHQALRDRLRSQFPILRLIAVVIAAALAGGAIEMAAAEALRSHMSVHGAFQQAFGGRVVPMIYYTCVFLGWALGYFWLTADLAARTEQLRRAEAQSAAARAELQQLRVQIDPHFLFNALNTVTAEIPDRPETALEMVRRISGYLRYCLDHQDRSVCRLADEIDAVRSYLRIQELRFDRGFSCAVDLDPEAADLPVPHLILQGLLENAVKHGLRPTTGAPLQIKVSARLEGELLTIRVSNPGVYAPRPGTGSGLGLVNVRRRLELHYPRGHHFAISQEGPLVVARMILKGPICYA